MSIAQASTTPKAKRPGKSATTLRRDGNEDLWEKLDAKLAEREEFVHTLQSQGASRPSGWLRSIVQGMGFGHR